MQSVVPGLVDPAALLLMMAANATPVLAARMLGARFAWPIDAAFRQHTPVFGAHKTWRGLLCGTGAAAAVGAWLPCGAWLGAGFGLLALMGDLMSSFIKRRMGTRPGTERPLLDQLPESLLPLLVFAEPLGLTAVSITGTAASFFVLDLLTARWRESRA